MARIAVAGLINLEVTCRVDAFPVPYEPVTYPFFGVNSTVSGVGFNIAKALTVLGDEVNFLSLAGQDAAGRLAIEELAHNNIRTDWVRQDLDTTAHSVILYDPNGQRRISTDLKDIQERTYPLAEFRAASQTCDLAVLCNINFARPFLFEALKAGQTIATDVHTISDLDDDYNRDFMSYADILFMSHEGLPMPPEGWLKALANRYGPAIAVVGLGAKGVLLWVKDDNFLERIPPATPPRPIVNTIGAGDALFSAFNHFYAKSHDPYAAIQWAQRFASYKIGESGAAQGFLTEAALQSQTLG